MNKKSTKYKVYQVLIGLIAFIMILSLIIAAIQF